MKVSLIATTYNQPGELRLYLQSLARQTQTDFEVVIADDGSRPDTKAVVDEYAGAFAGRLRHVWHPDEGYRKAKILNQAIRASSGEWLIFTDSDLVLHPRFVEDHVSQGKSGRMFMGRRVDLNPAVSDWVRSHPDGYLSAEFYLKLFRSALGGDASFGAQRSLRVGNPLVARALGFDRVPDLLGSNFSIDRELLYRVNGFDESSEHYWGEDGDLFVRVRNAGGEIVGRKCFAVQFHLWHPRRDPDPKAEAAYQRKLADFSYTRCARGLTPS